MLERLARNEYYCFLDRFYGYFQIPIDPQDQEKITFTCPYRTFAYRRMPFGLCNAPSTFQRCMMAILHDMIEETMEVFMDDFSIFGDSFSYCLSHLDKMLKRCEDTNLCNLIISEFDCSQEFTDEIGKLRAIFGHVLRATGVQIREDNLDNLHSLREVDGILVFVDPQDLLGSCLLADIGLITLVLLTDSVFLFFLGFLEYTNLTTGLGDSDSRTIGFLEGTSFVKPKISTSVKLPKYP
ncbi:reverse transcriptase domain-containing protein [Tanacetum coccineum]